ncbi:MAG: hypothetical protein LH702_26370 [Phormidesmis sp. CAN_BIN44]|nr:hypothetical protein [Phormidesmis sp. CAN_BIN44]
MSFLPEGTILGNLEMIEVYEFYDKPCLFSCRNVAGHLFLALWVDESAYADSWLYVPTSLNRFKQIVAGNMELRRAFLTAEDGFVFEVTIPCNQNDHDHTEVTRIKCETLEEGKLPLAGEFLESGTQVLASIITNKQDAKRSAIQFTREILDLAFSFSNTEAMQASAAPLGSLLQATQYLIDALGQFKAGQPTMKGNIPERILRQTELLVAGTFAGSFGVEFISVEEPDFWGDSLAGDAIESFLELIKIGKDAETLRKYLLTIQPRAASRYRVFLEKLINSKAKLRAEWGSLKLDRGGSCELLLIDAKIALEIVTQIEEEKPKQYEIDGELVGVNKRTKSFEILETKSNRKYSGRILDLALSVAETATLSEIYTSTIREIIEVTPATGEEKTKYQLVGLKPTVNQ